jgi:hypothetical protein
MGSNYIHSATLAWKQEKERKRKEPSTKKKVKRGKETKSKSEVLYKRNFKRGGVGGNCETL